MQTVSGRQKDAAFKITAGSYEPIWSWIFLPGLMLFGGLIPYAATMWKFFVTIEGKEYELKFGEPVTIPVSAGHHELEFCVAGKWGGKCGRYKYPVSVAPGYVQPLLYRMGHLLAGMCHPFRCMMVVKKSDPEMSFSNQGYAPNHGYTQQMPLAPQQFMAPPSDYDPYAASQPSHEQTRPATPKQTQPTDNGKKRFCTQCGEKNDTGSRFCGGCGQKLMT